MLRPPLAVLVVHAAAAAVLRGYDGDDCAASGGDGCPVDSSPQVCRVHPEKLLQMG